MTIVKSTSYLSKKHGSGHVVGKCINNMNEINNDDETEKLLNITRIFKKPNKNRRQLKTLKGAQYLNSQFKNESDASRANSQDTSSCWLRSHAILKRLYIRTCHPLTAYNLRYQDYHSYDVDCIISCRCQLFLYCANHFPFYHMELTSIKFAQWTMPLQI
jgi:hypothetical protein